MKKSTFRETLIVAILPQRGKGQKVAALFLFPKHLIRKERKQKKLPMKYLIFLSVSLFTSLNVISQTVDQQVDNLLRLMTLEEKAGQITQDRKRRFGNAWALLQLCIS